MDEVVYLYVIPSLSLEQALGQNIISSYPLSYVQGTALNVQGWAKSGYQVARKSRPAWPFLAAQSCTVAPCTCVTLLLGTGYCTMSRAGEQGMKLGEFLFFGNSSQRATLQKQLGQSAGGWGVRSNSEQPFRSTILCYGVKDFCLDNKNILSLISERPKGLFLLTAVTIRNTAILLNGISATTESYSRKDNCGHKSSFRP